MKSRKSVNDVLNIKFCAIMDVHESQAIKPILCHSCKEECLKTT